MRNYIYLYITCLAITLLMMVSCTFNDVTEPSTPGNSASVSVAFRPYIVSAETRATYPSVNTTPIVGAIDSDRLKTTVFGVFAQHTSETAWESYDKTVTPFNFMWNQQVTWDTENSFWTYSPVKYWPNDNQPADLDGATGSQEHSYLSFMAYAPYVEATDLPATGHSDATADGIVEMSANSTSVNDSYLYYRTSNDKPFGPEESVDLLWASQQDLWKMKESGEGYVDGQVNLPFRHALSKLEVTTKLLVDRTSTLTSDAYSTELDSVSRVFIDEATITTPNFYPEGKLMIGQSGADPVWDYTGVTAKDGFKFYSTGDPGTTSYVTDLVNFSMRYADTNIPQSLADPITDSNDDGIDDVTGLTEAETVKEVFKTMAEGVTTSEKQLSANYSTFMFPPSANTSAIAVNIKYHVVTFDEGLTLNVPKYYSNVLNDITATLGDSSFQFESNKRYKLVLNLGLTSAKFEAYVLDDSGEYILLSAVVKEWDLKTIEADVVE